MAGRTTGIRKNAAGNFEARFRRKGLPEISKSFPTQKDAKAWLDTMNAKASAGKSVASPDSFTIGQALEEYAQHIAKPVVDADGETTQKVDPRVAAYLHGLLPHFGKFSIGFLRAKHIAKYVELMRITPIPRPKTAKKVHPLYAGAKPKVYAESTIRKFIYTLKTALDFHAKNHGYTYDPHLFADEKPAAWGNVRKRRLDGDEEARILDACRNIITRDGNGNETARRPRKNGEVYANFVRLLLETATRYQEIALAEWAEFDFARRSWSIPKEHVKTGVGREVPLSKAAVSILTGMAKDGLHERPFGSLPAGKAVYVTWKRICKDAMVDDLGFHDFRHEAISRWVLRGGSDIMISKAAGHDVSVMQEYAHLRGHELLTFVDA